jgi:hypothetical protein
MLKNLGAFLALVSTVTVFMYANVAKADMVTDGLVSYWSLDKNTIKGDTVEDIWGENDGTIKGNPKQIGGKIGEALKFNGSEDSVDITGTQSLNFNGKKELTVTAWANVGAKEPVIGVVAGCCGTIVAQRDANGWALRYDGRDAGKEMEFIACPNWQGHEDLGAPIGKFKEGEWHYLTGVVNKDKLLLYVDGEFVKERAFAGPITSKGPETEIGHANDGGFIGIIDEVGIYNKALSEKEVKQNYQSKMFAAVNPNDKLAICWGKVKASR